MATLRNDGDVRDYITFLDGDEFLPIWGFGEDNCGNETNLAPKGDIERDGTTVTSINNIEEKGTAVCERIPLTRTDKMSEFVFLGLRCTEGISIDEFEKRFGCSVYDIYGEIIEKYIKMSFLICDKNRIRFADKAFFVSNTILAEFV